MFSGIIEELGLIHQIIKDDNSWKITIKSNVICNDLQIGASVCVNGVCLTVEKFTKHSFCATIIKESLNKTTLSMLKKNDKVNLEQSLRYNDRISGHLVQGHVEGMGKVLKKNNVNDNFVTFTIELDKKLMKYCIYKGSITIDGISLTISNINDYDIEVSIIPHTLNNTTLFYRNAGDTVNIETDMIAKYIEKIVV